MINWGTISKMELRAASFGYENRVFTQVMIDRIASQLERSKNSVCVGDVTEVY